MSAGRRAALPQAGYAMPRRLFISEDECRVRLFPENGGRPADIDLSCRCAKAACRLTGDDSGTRRTPDIGNCQPSCANIARTDRDIASVRQRADDLAGLVADPLAPPIRHQREQRELHRLHQIIEHHQETAP